MTTPFDKLKSSAEAIDDNTILHKRIEFTSSVIQQLVDFAESNTEGTVGDLMDLGQSIYFTLIVNLIKNAELDLPDTVRCLEQTQKDQLRFCRQVIDQLGLSNG